MNTPAIVRAAAAVLAAGFLALAGCGGEKPQAPRSGDGKGEPKSDPAAPAAPPRKIDPAAGVGKDAFEFLKALGAGAARAEQLSAGFVKMIGLPAELPADRARGYSPAAAESWMRRVGGGATFALPSGFAGADAAVLWGGFQGPGRKGDYLLRMVNEGGAWKVDHLALTSAPHTAGAAGDGPDAEFQAFAARAAGGLLCDRDAMPKDERAIALAAALTPAFRANLAEPFGSDREQGFDFNRGKLLLEADRIGGGAESYATARQGPAEFRLEVVKAGAKAAYLLRLAKGPAPGQWLVENVTPQ
jgi:hypothetical protein